jgi:tetratricopeptide (TPR) repeat protein
MLLITILAGACAVVRERQVSAPASAQAYFTQGFAALRDQDWQTAQQAFSAGLQIEPQRPEALTGRGWAWLEFGQPSAAITDFTAALALNPQDASAWAGRGRANLEIGNDQAAIIDLSQAPELSPLRRAYTDAAGLIITSITSGNPGLRAIRSALGLAPITTAVHHLAAKQPVAIADSSIPWLRPDSSAACVQRARHEAMANRPGAS